jgi:opacity protein-like surface antigen
LNEGWLVHGITDNSQEKTMKVLCSFIIFAVATTSVSAQPREGKNKELSISGSYQNYSSEGEPGSSGAFLISPRFGIYVVDELELEPEILFLVGSGSDPVYMLNGNISYNFIHSGTTFPFVLAGYGIANTIPFFNVPLGKTDFTVGVLNLGAGTKIFFDENVALRVEYRFQNLKGEHTRSFGDLFTYTEKLNMRIHTIQFGFSVLL